MPQMQNQGLLIFILNMMIVLFEHKWPASQNELEFPFQNVNKTRP